MAGGKLRVVFGNETKGLVNEDKTTISSDPDQLMKYAGLGVQPEVVISLNGAWIVLCSGSVVEFSGDAVVNSTNEGMIGGGGLDGAINERGGDSLREARLQIRTINYQGVRCPAGMARLTVGGDLPAKFCLHAVASSFGLGERRAVTAEKRVILASAISSAMNLAADHHEIETVAFPILCSGQYRGDQPLERIIAIHLWAISDAIQPGMTVYLTAFTPPEREVLVQTGKSFAEGTLPKYNDGNCCTDMFSCCTGGGGGPDNTESKDRRNKVIVLAGTMTLVMLTMVAFTIVLLTKKS